MDKIDARGLSCPEPVVMLKNAMMSQKNRYDILVDNVAARENVTRYGEHQGYRVTVQEENGAFLLTMTK